MAAIITNHAMSASKYIFSGYMVNEHGSMPFLDPPRMLLPCVIGAFSVLSSIRRKRQISTITPLIPSSCPMNLVTQWLKGQGLGILLVQGIKRRFFGTRFWHFSISLVSRKPCRNHPTNPNLVCHSINFHDNSGKLNLY